MVNPGELVRYAGDIETAVWRLSSSSHTPMTPAPRRYQGAGRFDDPTIGSTEDTEGFSVMYCADSAKVVFLEILAGLRPGIDELRSLVSPVVIGRNLASIPHFRSYKSRGDSTRSRATGRRHLCIWPQRCGLQYGTRQ